MFLCTVCEVGGDVVMLNRGCEDIDDGIDQFMQPHLVSVGTYTAKFFSVDQGGLNQLVVFSVIDGIQFVDTVKIAGIGKMDGVDFLEKFNLCQCYAKFTKGPDEATIGPMVINDQFLNFLHMNQSFDSIKLDIENFGAVDVEFGLSYKIDFVKNF